MALAAAPLAPYPDWAESPGGSFQGDFHAFVDKYVALWENAGAQPPLLPKRYEERQQRENERHLDILINLVEKQLRGFPDSVLEQEDWHRNLLAAVRRVSTKTMGLPEAYLDILFSRDYIEVTKAFVRQARKFNTEIQFEDLGQAMRNVWVTNYLQILMDQQPALRPAIFAYSMLYPYTDNYLDRPDLSPQAKAAFNQRFGLRLAGAGLLPLEPQERQVFRLVEIIESEYSRYEFPDVYRSLLAIHRGQVRSLDQQGAACRLNMEQLLRISVEKGGASVLADGYLIDGRLNRAAADFFFGFGVLLQLQDDLQDLQPDRNSQRWTIFSRTSAAAPLDEPTSRLCRFMKSVLETTRQFSAPRFATMKELIENNCQVLMLQSIAINSSYYSHDYLQYMEPFSPLSFSCLRKLLPRLEKKQAGVMKSFRRRTKPVSIFDLLC